MPFIELRSVGGGTYVASDLVDTARSADELWDVAERQVDELNELGVLADWEAPFRLTSIAVELRPDGTEQRYVRPIVGSAAIALGRVRARAVGVALGPDGQPIPSPRTLFERAIDLKRNPGSGFSEALALMNVAGKDRKLLWIVWECIRDAHGWPRGKSLTVQQKAAFYSSIGTDEVQANRFWKSAHLERHYKPDPIPGGEMSAEEMRMFLENCLRAWVNRVVPR